MEALAALSGVGEFQALGLWPVCSIPPSSSAFMKGAIQSCRTHPSSDLPVPPLLRPASLTICAGVIHEDDFLQQDGRAGVQDAVYCAQQSGPGFVVEHNDHAGGGQWRAAPELLVNTPGPTEGWTQLSPRGEG